MKCWLYYPSFLAMQDILQPTIDPAERISRFILSKDLFNSKRFRISPQAFKPAKPQRPGDIPKTSVYRTERLVDAEVWAIGDEYVTKLRNDRLPVLARGDIQARKILDLDLKLMPDQVPHPRHANVTNWPDEPEARQMKATLIAQQAQLVPRDQSS
jgi:hypothetical protein